MNTLTIIFIAFGVISLGLAAVYFYIFARSQERFIQYWGLCWVCYSCSLLFLILGSTISIDSNVFFVLRKAFDMFNILFLMFGVYAFPPCKIPGYWLRFSLYLCLWALLAIIYNFDLLSIYIPTSMFQLCITTMLSYIILIRWDVPNFERLIAIAVFSVWGYGKAIVSMVEALNMNSTTLYLAEIIFSNVLNFIVFVIYLQHAQSKLEVAEKMFKVIAENASDVIFFYDIKKRYFSYITPSVRNMLGYMPSDFYADGRFYTNLVNSDYQSNILSIFDYTQYDSKERTEIIQMYHKNSQAVWAEVSTTIIYEEDAPIGLEGIIRNITTMKNAEDQLIASKQARDTLFSYISHELKTPIASILAHASALQDDLFESPEKRDEAIDIIYKKTRTLERLIYDLFQLSKLQNKQFDFKLMLLDGAELMSEIMGRHKLDAGSSGLKLVLHGNKSALNKVYVIADAYRIEQVFTNILDNAMRFSKPKGEIQILFDLDKEKKNFFFSITNFGPVITPEQLAHIFDRFYRVNHGDSSAKETTSGLGLTISKEIIEAHKGSIEVKSSVRRGTTFTVKIPLYVEDDA